jgi:glycosyltransferase involved in cell wall biosynthesis
VILPTFNRSHSLVAAINSVLMQSYKNIELIVVDDASSEDIEAVVKGVKDDRIHYVRRPRNGGAGAARNTGLARAQGDYIAFQDSDDIWLPQKLERQVELLSSLPTHIGVVTGAKIIYGRDSHFKFGQARVSYAPSPNGRLRIDENQMARLLTENRISVQNALFRRGCFPGTDWFDICARANEDWEFAIRLTQHTTIHEDIEPVVLGFISADSISRNARREAIGQLRILRKNKLALKDLRYQRSLLLLGLSRYLFKLGKRRSANRFLLASVLEHPFNIRVVVASSARKVLRCFHLGVAGQRQVA